jgi:hypothetical protein
MQYIEYIENLRYAFKIISSKAPEILELIDSKAKIEADIDLELTVMSDVEWQIRQDTYLDIEDKIYNFNPDVEYGMSDKDFGEY